MEAYADADVKRLVPVTVTFDATESARLTVGVTDVSAGVTTKAVLEATGPRVRPATDTDTDTVPVSVKSFAAMVQTKEVEVAETKAHGLLEAPTVAVMDA
jgi:hypothetical protein